jgi:hypothetical protein
MSETNSNELYDIRKRKLESIRKKYINNNFETSTNGSCGIDLENEKIFKCSDNQYCTRSNECSTKYNKYPLFNFGADDLTDLNSNYLYASSHPKSNLLGETKLYDLSSNLMHGDKYNEELDKWLDDKTESIRKKYINNNFETSTNGRCGIDLENQKIFKCSDNQYCTRSNECSTSYDENINNSLIFYRFFNFGASDLTDINSNPIYSSKSNSLEKTKLYDLNSNLMHGDKFNEYLDKWLDDKIKNNQYGTSTVFCGKQPDLLGVYKCENVNDCCINNKCKSGEICKNADPNSKFHGNSFINLDCNDKKILDSFKTFYYDKTRGEFKIVDIVKINKVDNNTCDIKYNFEGKFSGQNSRRITYEYYPNTGYVCTEIGGRMSGLTTLPLDLPPKSFVSIWTIIGILIFIGVIAFIVSSLGNKDNKKS